MKKLIKEFKQFITRGNVVDLTVAVIIGAAFSAIVTALTEKIIRPLINWVIVLISGGSNGLESAYTILKPGYTDDVLDLSKSIYIDWGAFIAAVLNFLLIALVLFTILKVYNASKDRLIKLNKQMKKELKRDRLLEKKAWLDKARKEGRKYREVKREALAEKERIRKEREEAEEKEKLRIAEEERLKNPSTQDLLKEIRDLLKEKANK